jgi:putative SOS response-associated peptidase YedK
LFRRRDRAPFWLGGLWERWVGADGGELETAVILTTAPNELMARVHDRMPVVIPDGLEQAWLEPDDGPSLRALQPLMAPWEPHAWEAMKLELQPPEAADRDGAGGRPGRVPDGGVSSGPTQLQLPVIDAGAHR